MNDQQQAGDVFLLYEEVNKSSAREITEWILENNLLKENAPQVLQLVINSEGGDVSAAFSIIDIMKSSKIPVRTIGTGEVFSGGLLIFMNGMKGERLLTPNTSILSHPFATTQDGNYHALKSVWKDYKTTHERMVKMYMDCTGLGRRTVNSKLLREVDTWLTPEEALKYRICDSIGYLS